MTGAPDWATVNDALGRALDLEGGDRDAYLASLHPLTREAVEPLLRDALADDPLLDHPDAVLGPLAEGMRDETIAEGIRVGPYRIGRLVGEGGMGRVYRARRDDGAFDKTVAVKVVRTALTLAGSDVAARLRQERALLATLDHPGIARLLDGGETDDGVPYLVTEFVDGEPITAYADAHALRLRQRVALVADVAHAVDHAHRRFVVHRDLKPSNVLVTERDGQPHPVVLDFGVAKMLQAAEEATAAFLLTKTGLRMLTPAYAAPELYEPSATVTAAADVYGLGALLYEVLTGQRPHSNASVPAQVEPTRPSKVVADEPHAKQRARALQGDLDTICLRALHPDPARRYPSAASFADDLTRYLEGRPVAARPDSWAYVAGRFARRNRRAVAAALVALAVLVGGLGVVLASWQNERSARTASEEAADLLAIVVAAADPVSASGRTVSVRETLEQSLDRFLAVESDALRATILHEVGRAYIRMGDPYGADSLLQRSLAAYGEDNATPEASDARIGLASTRLALGDPERALALGERVHRDHQNDADPTLSLRGLRTISRAYDALGAPDAALAVAEETWRRTPRDFPAEQQIQSLRILGSAQTGAGHVEAALRTLRQSYELSLSASGPEGVEAITARHSLASALVQAGSPREAESLLRTNLEYQIRVFGPNTVAWTHASIANAQAAAGDDEAAAASLSTAITMLAPRVPANHADLGRWHTARAEALNRLGQHRPAETAARHALEIAEARADSASHETARRALAVALRGRSR